MELLSPAGTKEKLITAYAYGADAAYMGLRSFSLRVRAGNFADDEWSGLAQLKQGRKLYGTLNIFFHEDDIDELKKTIPIIKNYPFDAFIVSDMGVVDVLKNAFPETELHLSTQANCLNGEAVKLYKKLGFSRIILGRETPLNDIKRIKDAVPDMEIEAFVHGAMCMAYSGRCFLSSHLTGRSANQGDCAHTCRWNYRFGLEESERPGVWYPIHEDDGYTTILSSKDLCMIDHLADLQQAGIDSIKIEGRMKSLYYVATVTRAYRKALDALAGLPSAKDWKLYRDELFNISHREYTTGFFYGTDPPELEVNTTAGYQREYLFLGIIREEVKPNVWSLDIRNQIGAATPIEYIGPDVLALEDDSFTPLDENFNPVATIDHGKIGYIQTNKTINPGYLIRKKLL